MISAGVCSHGSPSTCIGALPPFSVICNEFDTKSKNIERGRNSSYYIALCAKSVGNFTTVTDRQLLDLGNL